MRKSKSSPLELGPNLCLLATVTVVYTFYSQFVSFIFSEPYAIPLMTAYDICKLAPFSDTQPQIHGTWGQAIC